jgi:hypothetical protein
VTFPERIRAVLASDASAPEPLAIFRIGLATVALLQALMLWAYRDLLLNEYGVVPWLISDPMTDPLFLKVSHVAALLRPLGADADASVAILLAIHMAAAGALLVGYRTRAAAIATWLTYVPLKNTGILFTYGIGALLLIGLFYCMLMPVGRAWSLDQRAGRNAGADAEWVPFSTIVLRLHLCIVYAAAGLSKAMGEQWWTGDAVWRALSLPQFQQFDPTPLLGFTPALQAAAIGSVVLQLAYPVLVWTRLRALVVFFTELLHLGIAIFLGLWLFSLVMMVFNAGAFGQSLWRALSGRSRMIPPRPSLGSP